VSARFAAIVVQMAFGACWIIALRESLFDRDCRPGTNTGGMDRQPLAGRLPALRSYSKDHRRIHATIRHLGGDGSW
jgi:hypothetical protein